MNESFIKKAVPTLTISSGIAFNLSGLMGIGFYFISFFDIINQPDKSITFWYLPFLLFGIVLLLVGIVYIKVGLKAVKGSNSAYKYSRYLLVIAGALLVIIIIVILLNIFELHS